MTIVNPTRSVFADILDDLAALYDRAYAGPIMKLYKENRPPKVYMQFLYSIDPHGFFVAEDKGNILGFIAVTREWQGRGETMTEVQDLVVGPAFESKDVGKILLQHGFAYARDKGLSRIGTWVGERNIGSRQIFSQFGFRQKYGAGKWVRMERPVRPA